MTDPKKPTLERPMTTLVGFLGLALLVVFFLVGLAVAKEFDSDRSGTYFVASIAVVLIGVLLGIFLYRRPWEHFGFLLGSIVPPIGWLIEQIGRKRQYDKVAEDLNQALKPFRLGDKSIAVVGVPPPSEADDVAACCAEFAEKLGCNARVLELLYRDSREESTQQLWTKMEVQDRSQLATILAKSEPLKHCCFDAEADTVAAIEWVFKRIDKFSLEQIRSEMHRLVELWNYLNRYTASNTGSVAFSKSFSPEEVTHFLGNDLPSKAGAAEDALVTACIQWFRAWGGERFPAPVRDSMALDSMALVSLGAFAAQTPYAEFPRLSQLALRAVSKGYRYAPDILFGYLWERSRLGGRTEGSSLEVLAEWMDLIKAARKAMHSAAVSGHLRGILRSELAHGAWPTQLPDHRMLARMAKQSEYLCVQINAARKDQTDGRKKVEDMFMQMGGEFARLVERLADFSDDDFFSITSKKAARKHAADEKAKDFAGKTFRPEMAPIGYLAKYQTILDTVGGLERQLLDLKGMLPDDARGGSAYVISFDQIRGPLADLIDSLAKKYHFKHYTRYARLGELQPGEGFENFYSKLRIDLEKLFEAATGPNPGAALRREGEKIGADLSKLRSVETAISEKTVKGYPWKRVEIKVERLSHSHDFFSDTAEDWQKTDLWQGFHDKEVFKWPPSPEFKSGCEATLHFAVSTHSTVAPGKPFPVSVWAFSEDQRKEMEHRAEEALDDHKPTPEPPDVDVREPVFKVRLKIAMKRSEGMIMWDGKIGKVTIPVMLPADAPLGCLPGVADVYSNGLQVARVHFAIQVESKMAGPSCLTTQEERHHTAFASYADEDRDAVLARVQNMQKVVPDLDVFMDAPQLRSRRDWRDTLWNEIPSRDVFYLFWSKEASKSPWVSQECKCALETRGRDFIEPVPLVSHQELPLPQ